jgi:hypothetical protein
MTATYRDALGDLTGINKGDAIIVHTDKGTLTGEFVSVNSKGVNIKVDGKIVARSMKSIIEVTTPAPDTTDGMTTRELAEMFNMEAKALRVQLRHMGIGVGKGQRYAFTPADVAKIKNHLTNA